MQTHWVGEPSVFALERSLRIRSLFEFYLMNHFNFSLQIQKGRVRGSERICTLALRGSGCFKALNTPVTLIIQPTKKNNKKMMMLCVYLQSTVCS